MSIYIVLDATGHQIGKKVYRTYKEADTFCIKCGRNDYQIKRL